VLRWKTSITVTSGNWTDHRCAALLLAVGQTTPECSYHRTDGNRQSYLCCALLEKACREGYSAYYAQAHKLFRQLAVAYVDGSYDRLLSRIARIDVLAIDDWDLFLWPILSGGICSK